MPNLTRQTDYRVWLQFHSRIAGADLLIRALEGHIRSADQKPVNGGTLIATP
jgi:hypothetical protein